MRKMYKRSKIEMKKYLFFNINVNYYFTLINFQKNENFGLYAGPF